MPIIVNLDVMMAKRKISSGDLTQNREGKSSTFLNTGENMRSSGLPAR